MLRHVFRLLTFVCLLGGSAQAGMTLSEALQRADLKCAVTGSGAGVIQVAITNPTDAPVNLDQPAGLICASSAGDARVITLRSTQLAVPAHGAAEAVIPAAALSVKNNGATQAFQPTADTEPRLAGLLDYVAKNNDTPRLTAQLVALCLLEDLSFARWQGFLAPQRVPTADPTKPAPANAASPSPAEVVAAVDALALLRVLAPERTFGLAGDSELKLRALRNPWCRAKAMQLYSMTLDGSAAPLPPDLGTLLHRTPGDNCPICRQRALLQPREDGP